MLAILRSALISASALCIGGCAELSDQYRLCDGKGDSVAFSTDLSRYAHYDVGGETEFCGSSGVIVTPITVLVKSTQDGRYRCSSTREDDFLTVETLKNTNEGREIRLSLDQSSILQIVDSNNFIRQLTVTYADEVVVWEACHGTIPLSVD